MGSRVAAAILLAATLAGSCAYAIPRGEAGLSAAVAERWERAVKLIPTGEDVSRAQGYFRAVALVNTGRVPEALKTFGWLSSTDGSFNGPALEKLVEYEFERGNYGAVVELYEKSKGRRFLDPPTLNYRVGECYFMVGIYDKALPLLAKVDSGELESYARYTMAQISLSDGDILGAIEHIDEAIDATKSHPDRVVEKNLSDYLRLARGRIIYKAAVATEDVEIEQREKLLRLAISQLSLIQEETPFYAESLRTIGWCSAEIGDMVRAIASFETAMTKDPENAHEDQWALGKVLERNEFYEEAASSYSEARLTALDWADSWEEQSMALTAPLPEVDIAWMRALAENIESGVSENASRLNERAALAQKAASLREERLVKISKRIGVLKDWIEALAVELDDMDAGLYKYLDIVQVGALFPKEDRPRIESLIENQDKLLAVIKWTQDAINTLVAMTSWEETPDFVKERAALLWGKIQDANRELAVAQLGYLEGIKKRVTVREKELNRMLAIRRVEHENLKLPYDEAVVTNADEKEKLKALNGKLALLVDRAKKVQGEIDDIKDEVREGMLKASREHLLKRAEALRLRADRFALDEAQALHLMQNELDRSGE
ncbi:MAG: hypothetical protein C0608_01215 [Deltaproteobacteria bacterium]|nr:MAG: hypothetical protein C0608_01215 [Deltaproteobacteria bacterium]